MSAGYLLLCSLFIFCLLVCFFPSLFFILYSKKASHLPPYFAVLWTLWSRDCLLHEVLNKAYLYCLSNDRTKAIQQGLLCPLFKGKQSMEWGSTGPPLQWSTHLRNFEQKQVLQSLRRGNVDYQEARDFPLRQAGPKMSSLTLRLEDCNQYMLVS